VCLGDYVAALREAVDALPRVGDPL
jgi:hypothetical protein